jgi:hypothetical protein
MRRAVLVSLGSAAPGEALLAGVGELRERGHAVTLISRTPPAAALAAALDVRLSVGHPGGTLQLGKLKLDPHRLPGAASVVLGRATRALTREADLLVAVDAAALPAVWLAAHLNRRAIAVTGLPAALTRADASRE